MGFISNARKRVQSIFFLFSLFPSEFRNLRNGETAYSFLAIDIKFNYRIAVNDDHTSREVGICRVGRAEYSWILFGGEAEIGR